MTTKYGDFWPPVFNAIGDQYKNSLVQAEPRDKGLAFKAPVSKQGKTNGACFDKLKPLYEGEKYVDSSRQILLAKVANQAGRISDHAFKPASAMKRSCGLGDYFGTFEGRIPYIAETAGQQLKKSDRQPSKPNLYTSPGKKGSYGYIGTTLSECKGMGGALGEYTYISQPPASLGSASGPKFATPFVPSNPPKRGTYGFSKTNIGSKVHGACGELQYLPVGAHEAKKVPNRAPGTTQTPWIPPRAPRHGHNRTLNEYPQYYADPEQVKADARRKAQKVKQAATAAGSPWHPAHIPKVGATRSIMRMNV